MFNRAANLAHICLRCQRRFASQILPWPAVETRPTPRISSRLQSTSTAVVEESEPEYEPPLEAEQNGRQEKEQPSDGHVESLRGKQYYKTWRPSQTVHLGMDALGKPAEVLLLPSRDRRILKIPEEARGEEKESFYETLKSETVPLSWEQLKENIDNIRHRLHQTEPQLEVSQWNALSQSLRKGFTLKQLLKYLTETRKAVTTAPEFSTKARNTLKSEAIRFITRELWGYKIPEHAPTKVSRQPGLVEQTTAVIGFGSNEKDHKRNEREKDFFEILQLDFGSSPLRQIALAHAVDISLDSTNRGVVIKGDKSAVSKARKEINQLKNNVISTKVRLEKPARTVLDDSPPESVDGLLRELSLRNGALVRKSITKTTSGELHLTYLNTNRDAPALIRRDLRLALRLAPPEGHSSTWPTDQSPKESRLVPVQPVAQLPWSHLKLLWRRLYASVPSTSKPSALAQLTDTQRESYESLSREVSASLDDNTQPPVLNKSTTLRHEYTARFGNALLARKSQPTRKGGSSGAGRMPFSVFVDDIPVLPHFLGTLKRWNKNTLSDEAEILEKPALVARLVYSPSTGRSSGEKRDACPIEMVLLGDDYAAGLKQDLRIARVSVIREKRSHGVHLPHNVVDVDFVREVKEDLFSLQSPTTVREPRLLKELANSLNHAMTKPDRELAPFIFLPFLSTRRPHETSETDASGEVVTEAPVDDSEAVSTPSAKAAGLHGKMQEYMLESAEIVDSDIYATPLQSRFALEYSSYQGGRWGPDRQEFRLADQPLLQANPYPKKLQFYSFFHAAMDVAEKLNNTAETLTLRKTS